MIIPRAGNIISARYAMPDRNSIIVETDRGQALITADSYPADWADLTEGRGVAVAPFLPPPPQVPETVTLAQARAALMASGHFGAVDAAIRASGDPVALMAWEYTNTVSRSGALVQALAPATGLSENQIDDLFRAAANIQL